MFAHSRLTPITLAPGEVGLIFRQHASVTDRKHADAVKEALVTFLVSPRLTEPKEWWHGHLVARTEIKRRIDPDEAIATSEAAAKQHAAEQADPELLTALPRRLAQAIAGSDRVTFASEGGPKREETILRDPARIHRLSESFAKVILSSRVACLCSGWRTATFYRGEQKTVSVAAIHGDQLRLSWGASGGDFPIDPAQWADINAALDEARRESSTTGH